MFRQLEKNIQPFMSFGAVATLVQQTLAVACDEHTSIDIWDDLKRVPNDLDLYYQPLTLTADKIIETKHIKPESSPRISSIGHLGTVRSDLEATRFFRSIMAADGCPGDQPIFTSFQPFLNHLLFNDYIGHVGPFGMIRNTDGKTAIVKNKFPVSPEQLQRKLYFERYKNPSNALIELGINPVTKSFWKLAYAEDPGVIDIHSADSKYSYIYVRKFKSGKTAAAALDKAMREVIKRKPEHVIVDLTTSPGGHTDQASRLLSYFLNRSHQIASKVYRRSRRVSVDKSFKSDSKQALKAMRSMARQFRRTKRRGGKYTLNVRRRSFGHPDYKGKVTVLVSPLTHSAATMAALILKKNRKATIIGYQNAGSVHTSCFAALGTYSLRHTKLKVRIPGTCFLRSGSSRKNRGPLVPDIKVDPLAQPPGKLIHAIQEAAVQHVLKSTKTDP